MPLNIDFKRGIRSFFARNLRYWQRLNFRKFLYFFHIATPHEKRLIFFLSLVVLISGIGFLSRMYLRLTLPVPETGGSYTEGLLREPRTINPLFAAQDADRDIAKLVFSGLLNYSGEGLIQPDLAERYEISEDGKTYTLYLREDVRWHDGKPFSAEDVLFTIKTIQNPRYKSVLRANWQGVSADKKDDYTVQFVLRKPYAPFIENLTVGILPRHLWEGIEPEQALLHELNLKPVGTGPYRFRRIKQDNDGTITRYELERNTHYYLPGPYLDHITFTFFSTEEEITTALRKGLIDGFGPVSAQKLLEFNPRKVAVVAVAMPRVFGIFFNERKNTILEKLEVRQAIAQSLNRTEIAQKATVGGAVPTDSPIPFDKFSETEESSLAYSPEIARELLERAGWKDTDGDGIRERKNERLRLTLTTSDWPDLVRASDLIRDMLREIGIEVVVQKFSLADLESSAIKPRNFEMLLFGQVYGYEPDPYTFWHSSQIKDPGLNISLYSNRRADRILEETRAISDPDIRRKKYTEFSSILTNDLPAIFLYSQLYLYLTPRDMKGVEISRISLPADRFNQTHNWYKETERKFKF